MPSPIAHTTAAYAIFVASNSQLDRFLPWNERRGTHLFLVLVFLCLLPDFGSIIGLVTGDFARFHNSWEHSLLVGLVVGLAGGAAISQFRGDPFWRWFVVVLLCYQSHVLMDYFTIGRGVMLFWPFSEERWGAPIKLFYGLHWSDGWWTPRPLWTAVTEIAFAAVVVTGLVWWKKDSLAHR